MGDTFADRLAIAMELKGVKSPTSLSRRTGIERSYLYRLISGDIKNPHKYVEALAKATGVCSHWLDTGKGSPYEHEKKPSQKCTTQGTLLTKVTVIPPDGECFDVSANVPDIFTSQSHKPRKPDQYAYYYVPEMIDCLPGFTLLMVEKEQRPGPGFFLAWRKEGDKKELCSFHVTFKGMDVKSTKEPDMEVIGRIRIMDYWEMEFRQE